jgi:hypothetical protein
MHGFGKNHEDLYEKRKSNNEEKKEKKETQYGGSNVDLELSVRSTVYSKNITNSEMKEQNANSDNSILSSAETSDKTEEGNEVLNSDKTVSSICNSAECLENENSESVKDSRAGPGKLQTENSGCADQDDNVVIHSLNSPEESIKTEKGKNIT